MDAGKGDRLMTDLLILFLVFAAAVLLIAIAIGANLFTVMVDEQVRYLQLIAFYAPLTEHSVHSRPDQVSRYLAWAAGTVTDPAGCAHVRFEGRMRLGRNGRWMPTGGKGYFSLAVPDYVWHATVTYAPGIWIEVCDYYVHRSAGMNFNLLSFIPLNNTHDKEILVSSLFRYLASTPLFPHVLAASDAVTWEHISDTAAIASIQDHGVTASALVRFEANGRLESIELHDPLSPASPHPAPGVFTSRFLGYKEMGGYQIPQQVVTEAHLADGGYACTEYTVTSVEYTHQKPALGEMP